MLVELAIRDYAIIDDLRLRLAPGFNVLTGETGAGKSIIVGALGLLLGERAESSAVRAGAERAVIEGVFEPGARADALRAVLEAYGIDEDPVLIVAREVHAEGRSTGRINGRAVPVRALAELGALLVDVHGQSDNASLKRETSHADLLDAFAGLDADRSRLAERVRRYRAAGDELGTLQTDEAALMRRADLLRFQVDEIEAAQLDAVEADALRAERARLANAERLAALADGAWQALKGDDESAGAIDRMDAAMTAAADIAGLDPSLDRLVETMAVAVESVAGVAGELRDYRDRLEADPERLRQLEERLDVIGTLKRKYGPEIADVLAFGARSAEELAQLAGASDRIAALEAERAALLVAIGAAAGELSAARAAAGERLAAAVVVELEDLGIAGSRFGVDLGRRVDTEGGAPTPDGRFAFDERGIDRVRFQISTNPGEPLQPLAAVASGGETARIMLALKRILTAADRVPTLVFDEVDAGIGGRIGDVVGRKLWQLGRAHQVLSVTHLPQVAVFGDVHYQVRKATADGRTHTRVERLSADERLGEVTAMLGAATDAGRRNAAELLATTTAWQALQGR
ncbi:MAG: DNA repair protein RecN [Ardenticatenales bacterium]